MQRGRGGHGGPSHKECRLENGGDVRHHRALAWQTDVDTSYLRSLLWNGLISLEEMQRQRRFDGSLGAASPELSVQKVECEVGEKDSKGSR